jgi:hypothetical protein
MSTTYVPLISSGTAGPLGVLHLPRLWLKVSLEARGKLASGYPGCGKGYDLMTCNALGINQDAVKKFITESQPTYPQFEAWVKKQPCGSTKDHLQAQPINLGYIHDDSTRRGILAASGVQDDARSTPGAVDLNNLDDWAISSSGAQVSRFIWHWFSNRRGRPCAGFLFPAELLRQCLNRDVLVMRLSFPAAMHLQTNQSKLWDGILRLGVVHGLGSIDEKLDTLAFRANFVIVPIALFQNVTDDGRVRLGENLVAA